MKFVSWNVNGLRACMNKGFLDTFYELNADFFCLQETKLQAGQITLDLPGYEQYWCYAEKKGYSGTAIFTKHTPMSVSYGLGIEELDTEGRVITLEYPEFFLVTCYTPNAQRGLARIEHRLKWEAAIRAYLNELDRKKPVILCGDLNVAHKEIDLKNPGSNRGSAGFSDEERSAFTQLLDSGFTDSFRHLYPDKTGAYSWWSYMFNARANNAGWRIDYFVVSDRLADSIHNATIHPECFGSDHCPVGLDLNVTCNGSIWSPETERSADQDIKKAGGDSLAGHMRTFFKIAIAASFALALIISITVLLGQDNVPTAPLLAAPEPVKPKLISEIIDRSGSVSLVYDFLSSSPYYSSQFEEKITDGATSWLLMDKTIVCTTQTPEADDDGDYTVYYPLEYNFFVQVQYADHSPLFPIEIEVNASYSGSTTVVQADYKDENGQINGCFLFGFTTGPLELQISATCGESAETLSPVTIYPTLFAQVTDHKGDIAIDIPFSTIGAYRDVIFNTESESWVMDRNNGHIDLNANYFFQVQYPEGTDFTDEDHPTIFAGLSGWKRPEYDYTKAAKVLHYYDSQGNIAGFFVFGYLTEEQDLQISIQYNETEFYASLHAQPYFESMPTDRLVCALLNSDEVRYYCLNGNIDELNKNHPGMIELLRRDNIIRAMLDANQDTHPVSSFDILLAADPFQSLMTDEEKEEFYEQLQRQFFFG